jgi:hypothetical protein
MRISREELLRQKALVEAQLAWLNHKLAETEPPSQETLETPLRETSTPAKSSEEQPVALNFPDSAGPGTLTFTHKIGCLLFAGLACATILFLIYVLPYLIY